MAENLKVDTLTAKSINIVDDKGKTVVQLTATDDGAGLWLMRSEGEGPMVAIYTIKGQAAIGFYPKRSGDSAMTLALSLDPEGEPYIQTYCKGKDGNDEKELKYIKLRQLADFMEKSASCTSGS